MSKIIDLFSRKPAPAPADVDGDVAAFLRGFSIEVMPRTAAKIESFREILPEGTRVYIAHIEGTPIEDMVATAKRIADEGFPVMPHFASRGIKDKAELAEWIAMYQGEAGVDQALLLGGGYDAPVGAIRQFHGADGNGSLPRLQASARGRPPGRQQGHRPGRLDGECVGCAALEAGLLRDLGCRDGDRDPVPVRGRYGNRLGGQPECGPGSRCRSISVSPGLRSSRP